MRRLVIAAVAVLSLSACAGTNGPTATSSPSLGKAEACLEFAKARPIKMDHPYMKAFDLIVKAGNDKAKVQEASDQLLIALRGMRADFEAIAARTTDAGVKTALTSAVSDIKVAEAELPGVSTDQAKVMAVLNKVNLRTVDAAC